MSPLDTIEAPAPPAPVRATAVPRPRAGPPLAWWAILPALLFLPVVMLPPLNHDVAAVLHFAQRWLGGERLYVDLIDVNPPLIFVLNLVPAALAAWTPLDGPQALQVSVLAFGLLGWRLCHKVRDRAAEGSIERAVLDALPVLFTLAAGYDFGQREHLMAIAALPYALLAARRAQGVRPGIWPAVAVMAVVGFALKPHFLAVPLLIEAAILLRRRAAALRDPVPWAMAAMLLGYVATLPLLFPEFLDHVVPLTWEFYVGLGGSNSLMVMFLPRLGGALWFLLLPVLLFAWRAGGVARMLALAAAGAAVSAVVQHRGWSYHCVPIELLAGGCAALLAARALDRLHITAGLSPRRLVAMGLVGALTAHAAWQGEAPWRQTVHDVSIAGRLEVMLREHAFGRRVLVLSPDIYPVFPAINYADARSTLRTMNLWLLQGAYQSCLPDGRRYREPWEMTRAEFFMYRTVAEDLARAPPSAILLSTIPGIAWCGEEFDFVAFFSRHPLFAQIWREYRQVAAVDHYRLLVRDD